MDTLGIVIHFIATGPTLAEYITYYDITRYWLIARYTR